MVMRRRVSKRKGRAPRRKTNLLKRGGFVKAVKAVISSQVEDKYVALIPDQVAIGTGVGRNEGLGSGVSFYGTPNTAIAIRPVVNNTVNSGVVESNCYQLLPPIFQGVQDNQRVGSSIRVKNMTLKAQVSLNGDLNVSSRDYHVRFLILIDKNIKSNSLLYPAIDNSVPPVQIQAGTPVSTDLFDTGISQTIGTNGNPQELMYRINKKRYTVLMDKQFRLCKGTGFSSTPNATTPYVGEQITVVNDNHSFSHRLKAPKVLKYEWDTDIYPQGYAPFWCAFYNQYDGDGRPAWIAANDNAVLVNTMVNLDWEDA